jgi:hypothetical protein
MIQRQASIKTRIGNYSIRATGITDYLKNNGSLAEAPPTPALRNFMTGATIWLRWMNTGRWGFK